MSDNTTQSGLPFQAKLADYMSNRDPAEDISLLREVERKLFNDDYEGAYELYLRDTIANPPLAYDDFIASYILPEPAEATG